MCNESRLELEEGSDDSATVYVEAPGLKIVGILSKQDQCICKILGRTPHLLIVLGMLMLMLNYKVRSIPSSLP